MSTPRKQAAAARRAYERLCRAVIVAALDWRRAMLADTRARMEERLAVACDALEQFETGREHTRPPR